MLLYVHIPFCRRKCRYCDFASWAGAESHLASYAEDVAREAEMRASQLGPQAVQTVFLGGGTPSAVPAEWMRRLLESVFRFFPPEADAEFTSEANPGTLTPEWLDTLLGIGLNRLSLGMQAAQPELLRLLGRIHSPERVRESVELARSRGIRQLNLDLMFGLPTHTLSQWEETLEAALQMRPEHLSCYGLIPEEGTPLQEDLTSGRLSLPEEGAEREMYDTAIRRLREAGLCQYEISNFARPGSECRHNLGYWRRVPYLGLGLSAASMLELPEGCVRETNPSSFAEYHAMVSGECRRERETVSESEAAFETLMLGLRLNEGVRDADFAARFGYPLDSRWGAQLQSLERRQLVVREDGCLRLTRRGMDIQNSVLVELMDENGRS